VSAQVQANRWGVRWPQLTGGGSEQHLGHGAFEGLINQFVLSPVLGEACSILGRETTVGWRDIIGDFQRLITDDSGGEEAKRYLVQLGRKKLRLTEHDLRSRPAPLHRPAEPLDGLRLAMARLGSAANFAFGLNMGEFPVADVGGYSVELDPSESFRALAKALVAACLEAYRLHVEGGGKGEGTPPSCEPGSIYDALASLAAGVLDWSKDQDVVDTAAHTLLARDSKLWAGVRASLAKACANKPGRVLTFQELAWLAELLWYAFRVEAPVYPSHQELSFQLGLVQPPLPLTLELDRLREGRDALLRKLTHWLSYYEKGNTTESGTVFHCALARYLSQQYRNYQVPLVNNWRAKVGIEAIAFSMNLDLSLEQALRETSSIDRFHVCLPIIRREAVAGGEECRLVWLLGTYEAEDQADAPSTWVPMPEVQDLVAALRGPLVVKLHGSPLHRLPLPEYLKDAFAWYEHALTIADYDFFRDIVQGEGMLPATLHAMLHRSGRVLCFFGQVLDDWDIRWRMYDLAFPRAHSMPLVRAAESRKGEGDSQASETGAWVVNRRFQHWSAVLRALGLQVLEDDLENVTDSVNSLLDRYL